MPKNVLEDMQSKITDAKLLACIDKHASKYQWQSPAEFTQLICHNMGISNTDGLELFSQLQKISLYKNKLKKIDISPFLKLKHLNVARNDLTKLSLQNHKKLRKLYVFNNKISSLHLLNMPQLQQLKGNSNSMLVFNYQSLPQLGKIYLFDNQMETIDINNLPAIRYMDVRENPMPDDLYEAMDVMPGVTILHDGNAEDWNQ